MEGTDWEFSEFSLYDLGQAVAHLTLQAQALGLHARQFRAFDREGVTREFGVPEHWEVTTMVALGCAASEGAPRPSGLLTAPPSRQRKPLNDVRWPVA